MKRFYRWEVAKLILYLCFFGACNNPFSFSPFEVDVPVEFHGTTAKNLKKIADLESSASPEFKIALLSDAHYHFDHLRDALDEINKKDDILFIIVTGDITENGLQKEFELFHRIMASSRKPYLTVIGNHDYLSNGALVYQKMYGPVNYSFTFQNVKFVMWDNVLWESNKKPDWDWFETELAESPADGTNNARPYTHVIPFSHIPPTDGQMELDRKLLHGLLQQHQIDLSIHGHKHEYSLTDVYEDGIQYLTVGSPQNRVYAELTITPDDVKVERIDY